MSRSWSTYEGLMVGAWRLESFLGEREDRAFFVARNAARERPALAELVDSDAPGAASREASWREAAKLSHQALLSVHETGEGELDGEPVAYAVLDLPDDDLSEVLTRRTLDADEARSTFASIASALEYLHARGLRHDAVAPGNVFLVGNEIKLSVDTIAPADGGGKESDLRQFGGTLIYAMTGNADAVNGGDPRKSAAVTQLPPPFYEIAVGCLNGLPDPNWSARRIFEILSSRPARPRRNTAPETNPQTGQKYRHWTVAVAGAVAAGLIAGYVYVGRPSHQQPQTTRAAAAAPEQPVPAPADARPVVKPAPGRAVDTPPGRAADAPPAAPHHRAAGVSEAKGSWAVIAATYSSFNAAEKRAAALRNMSSRLHPHVFPRDGEGRRYYVVLGSSLTQDAAHRLRALATSLGAPKDTYVTKLDES